MQIAGNVALVTGAGSGLGAATARHLAALGARIVALDRDGAAAGAVAGPLGGLATACDITRKDQVEAAFAKATQHYGAPPRLVVSCAGVGTAGRILPRDGHSTLEEFERTVQVNLVGTYAVMATAARAMAEAPVLDGDGARGVIINTASVAWEDGQIGQAAYAASKGGIAAMTLPAARELARYGIRVMTIAPGLFDTAMTAGLPEDSRAGLAASIPFPARLGQPAEFALLVEQILRNPMLNGTVIRLDGAVRLPPR